MKKILPAILFTLILCFGAFLIIKSPANTMAMEKLLKNGKTAKAKINKVGSFSSKHGTSYTLDVSWRDDKGKPHSRSGVNVKAQYPMNIDKLQNVLRQRRDLTDVALTGVAADPKRIASLQAQVDELSFVNIKYLQDGLVILEDEEKLYRSELTNNNDFVYGLIAAGFGIIGLLLLFFVNPLTAQIFFMAGGLGVVAYYHLVIEPLS